MIDNLIIVGKDSTRYFIPVNSVASIVINKNVPAIHFNLVPEVWQESGCKSFDVVVSSISVIDKFIKDYRKNGGRGLVSYALFS